MAREAMKMEIESVRVPKERIDQYRKNIYDAPNDISLIRTRHNVAFNNHIAPVNKNFL